MSLEDLPFEDLLLEFYNRDLKAPLDDLQFSDFPPILDVLVENLLFMQQVSSAEITGHDI
jgi:hypothetical protein